MLAERTGRTRSIPAREVGSVAVHAPWQSATEPQLETLVESCNQLHGLSVRPASHQHHGPWQWTESCSRVIAMPRDVLTFEVALTSLPSPRMNATYRARLIRHFTPGLIYDQIDRIELDGHPIRPTNGSLSRTLDLQFNQISSGSRLSIVYQARVHFRAEPMRVVLGDTRLRWSRLPNRHNRIDPTGCPPIERLLAKRNSSGEPNERMIQESHSPLQLKSHVRDSGTRSASPGRSARGDGVQDQHGVVGQTT